MALCQENLNSGWSGLPEIFLFEAGIAKRLFSADAVQFCRIQFYVFLHVCEHVQLGVHVS